MGWARYSHWASGVRVTVTKSAVMNTEATPSRSKIGAIRSSASAPDVNVAGPPTGVPTVNFKAFGFGVFSITTPMDCLLIGPANRSRGER